MADQCATPEGRITLYAPGGVRIVPTDMHPGKLGRFEGLVMIQDTVQNELDSLSEMAEMESLRLQMAMDRLSKLMAALSNLLKKGSDTAVGGSSAAGDPVHGGRSACPVVATIRQHVRERGPAVDTSGEAAAGAVAADAVLDSQQGAR